MKKLAICAIGLGLAGAAQAVPITYDFTGSGTVNTYLGVGQTTTSATHMFTGTMTIDVNPAGLDGTVFGNESYGYNWVTSHFTIGWDNTLFVPAPEPGQTSDYYASLLNSNTEDRLYNQARYSELYHYTYAALTRSTSDTSWLSDLYTFPETIGLAPGSSAKNEILFGREHSGPNYTGFYGSMRLSSLTARPTTAVPEPGTLALFGLGLLGTCFRCRRAAV